MNKKIKGKKTNLKGKRFGRLAVIKDSGKRKCGQILWLCQCDCGNIKEIPTSSLQSGATKSCGCLSKELASKRAKNQIREKSYHYKHGAVKTSLYVVWIGIKGRCNNKKNSVYPWYGQKGIQICDEWKNDFRVFKDWALNNGYKEGLTIDRIDNNGNYEPSNCQWITKSENVSKSNKLRSKNVNQNNEKRI